VSMAAHAARRLSTWRTILPAFSALNCLLRRKGIGLRLPHATSPALAAVIAGGCASRCRRLVSIATWPTIFAKATALVASAHCGRVISCSRTTRFQYLPVKDAIHERALARRHRMRGPESQILRLELMTSRTCD